MRAHGLYAESLELGRRVLGSEHVDNAYAAAGLARAALALDRADEGSATGRRSGGSCGREPTLQTPKSWPHARLLWARALRGSGDSEQALEQAPTRS